MPNKFLRAAIAAMACIALVSCASGPYVQKENDVLKLVRLINEGRVGEVEGLARAPFVLDGETLYLDSDVATMWRNLKAASFAMADARFVGAEPVGPESYRVFADSFDMKNYFEKYAGIDASIVTLETASGRYYLLLNRKVKGYPRIQGLKGPVR